MHFYSPHLITDHQSETEWAWEGGETEKPHERRLRIHLSFYYCKSQSSKSLSLEDLTSHFWPVFRFYLCHFVFKETELRCTLNSKSSFFFLMILRQGKGCRALHKLSSYLGVQDILAKLTWKARSPEELLSACLHMLMHDCKNQGSVVNAHGVYVPPHPPQKPSSAKMSRRTGAVEPSQWPKHTWTFSLTICLQCWSMPLMKYSV